MWQDQFGLISPINKISKLQIIKNTRIISHNLQIFKISNVRITKNINLLNKFDFFLQNNHTTINNHKHKITKITK